MVISSSNVVGKRVLSPQDIRDIYMYGINTVSADGRPLPDDVIEMYIDSAQEEIEAYLSIKLIPQLFTESLHYRYSDMIQWGRMDVSYPVIKPVKLVGAISGLQSIEYPIDWMSARQASDETYFRCINIVPSTPLTNHPLVTGTLPMPMYNSSAIPNYWTISYYTGYIKPPNDLINFIGKLAACNVFNNLGDLILGAGIASQSISIDGISQSIATTSSAENSGYSSRVKAYLEDLKVSLPRIESKYKGFMFGVL